MNGTKRPAANSVCKVCGIGKVAMEIAGNQVRGGNQHVNFTKNQQTQHRKPKSVTPTTTRSRQSNSTNETSTVLEVDSEFVNSTVFLSV